MAPSTTEHTTERALTELTSLSSVRDVFALGAVLIAAIAWAL